MTNLKYGKLLKETKEKPVGPNKYITMDETTEKRVTAWRLRQLGYNNEEVGDLMGIPTYDVNAYVSQGNMAVRFALLAQKLDIPLRFREDS